MKKKFILVCSLILSAPVLGGMVDDCEKFKGIPVSPCYVVSPDYWNKTKCPGDQCLKIDDQTGDFTVVSDDFSCGYNVASYPNILYGTSWGTNSGAKDLPTLYSSLKNVLTDWTIQTTRTGAWDAAYDIWFCPDHSCGPEGFNGGAEIMVWIDFFNTKGWKNLLDTVTIEGTQWEVWSAIMTEPGRQWQYVAYLPKTLMSSVKDLDLMPFFRDSVKRGLVKPSWWLYGIQAGNELHSQGVPFTSKGFSVKVNASQVPVFSFTPVSGQ